MVFEYRYKEKRKVAADSEQREEVILDFLMLFILTSVILERDSGICGAFLIMLLKFERKNGVFRRTDLRVILGHYLLSLLVVVLTLEARQDGTHNGNRSANERLRKLFHLWTKYIHDSMDRVYNRN